MTSDPDLRDRQEQGGGACVDASASISVQVKVGLDLLRYVAGRGAGRAVMIT